jgi:putative hydrolase of the HAD superfamily
VLSHILFDLDNTLYPSSTGFEDKTIELMIRFAAGHLGLSVEEARRLRSMRMPGYGTTLEWLRREHGPLDVDEYYAFVHPAGEEAILSPDPGLRELLSAETLPMSIFTNSPREHAERVLSRLGLSGLFDSIYDIRFFEFRGKPAREAYYRALDPLGLEPREVAFFDDSPRAVKAFLELGGNAFLIDESGSHRDYGLPSLPRIQQYRRAIEELGAP